MAASKSALTLLKPLLSRAPRSLSPMVSSPPLLLHNPRTKLPLVDNVNFSTVALLSRYFHSSSPRFSPASSSQVNPSKLAFTEIAWEGYLDAMDEAEENEQDVVETEHLMKALLEQEGGLAPRIFTKAGLDNSCVLQATDDFIAKQPKVSGGDSSNPIIGQHLSSLLENAIIHKKDMKDEFVSVEHFILAFCLDVRFGRQLLSNLGLSWSDLRHAIDDVRRRQKEQWGIEKEQIRTLKEEIDRINFQIRDKVEPREFGVSLGRKNRREYNLEAETVKEREYREKDEKFEAETVQLRISLERQSEEAEKNIAGIESKWTATHLEDVLHQSVVGQNMAVMSVADAIQRSGAGLSDPNRPIASFMFIGPLGVGKNELARTLAGHLFDTENSLLRINMNKYMEKHKVPCLVEVLTEAILRRPYRVLLFEEIEKAHRDFFSILLQVLDDGKITDCQGMTVSFINTVIIMTSKIGSNLILDTLSNTHYTKEAMYDIMKKQVVDLARQTFRRKFINHIDEYSVFKPVKQVVDLALQRFRPEFMNHTYEYIVFKPLDASEIRNIVEMQMRWLKDRLEDEEEIELHYTEEAIDVMEEIASGDPNLGAMRVKSQIDEIEGLILWIGKRKQAVLFNVGVASDVSIGDTHHIPAGIAGHYNIYLGTSFEILHWDRNYDHY